MFNFKGEVKRKKVVSLGGLSKKEERAAFLKRTKEARQRRLEAKQRLEAAICLQAAYRSYAARRRVMTQVCHEFDAGVAALLTNDTAGTTTLQTQIPTPTPTPTPATPAHATPAHAQAAVDFKTLASISRRFLLLDRCGLANTKRVRQLIALWRQCLPGDEQLGKEEGGGDKTILPPSSSVSSPPSRRASTAASSSSSPSSSSTPLFSSAIATLQAAAYGENSLTLTRLLHTAAALAFAKAKGAAVAVAAAPSETLLSLRQSEPSPMPLGPIAADIVEVLDLVLFCFDFVRPQRWPQSSDESAVITPTPATSTSASTPEAAVRSTTTVRTVRSSALDTLARLNWHAKLAGSVVNLIEALCSSSDGDLSSPWPALATAVRSGGAATGTMHAIGSILVNPAILAKLSALGLYQLAREPGGALPFTQQIMTMPTSRFGVRTILDAIMSGGRGEGGEGEHVEKEDGKGKTKGKRETERKPLPVVLHLVLHNLVGSSVAALTVLKAADKAWLLANILRLATDHLPTLSAGNVSSYVSAIYALVRSLPHAYLIEPPADVPSSAAAATATDTAHQMDTASSSSSSGSDDSGGGSSDSTSSNVSSDCGDEVSVTAMGAGTARTRSHKTAFDVRLLARYLEPLRDSEHARACMRCGSIKEPSAGAALAGLFTGILSGMRMAHRRVRLLNVLAFDTGFLSALCAAAPANIGAVAALPLLGGDGGVTAAAATFTGRGKSVSTSPRGGSAFPDTIAPGSSMDLRFDDTTTFAGSGTESTALLFTQTAAPAGESAAAGLQLFVEALGHHLLTVDDSEFIRELDRLMGHAIFVERVQDMINLAVKLYLRLGSRTELSLSQASLLLRRRRRRRRRRRHPGRQSHRRLDDEHATGASINTFSSHTKTLSSSSPTMLTGMAEAEAEAEVSLARSLLGLRLALTRFLRQAHARNTRLEFLPAAQWEVRSVTSAVTERLLQNVTAAEFEAAVEEEEAEAAAAAAAAAAVDGGSHANGDAAAAAAAAASGSGRGSSNGPAATAQRKRRLLRLLRRLPFAADFMARAQVFRRVVRDDRERLFGPQAGLMGHLEPVTVRRSHLYADAFEGLYPLGKQMRSRVRISLVNQEGLREAGIDGGGLFREFLSDVLKLGFDPACGYFSAYANQRVAPNPSARALSPDDYLLHYEFLGMLVGKLVYDGLLSDLPFARVFLGNLLGERGYLHDLADFDPDMHRSLLVVKNYPGDVHDLALDFSVTEELLGEVRTVDLVPGGQSIAVTNENRIRYVYHMADYYLNVRVRPHCIAFRRGLLRLLEPAWLHLFTPDELQKLISGSETAINVQDMRLNTMYARPYNTDSAAESGGMSGMHGHGRERGQQHEVIGWFWQAVERMSEEDKRNLLRFITSCPRPPLLGFRDLEPALTIGGGGSDVSRLPTASTCMNLLKLPLYTSPETLEERLLYAIRAGAGFELS